MYTMRERPPSTTQPLEAAEAAFWAAFIRNRNVDAATSQDGALAVAGGYALCVVGTFLNVAIGVGCARPLRDDDLTAIEAFYRARGLPARLELAAEVLERDRPLLRARGYAEDPLALTVLAHDLRADDAAGDNRQVTVRTTSDEGAWSALAVRALADTVPANQLGTLERAAASSAAAAHARVVAAFDGRDAGVGALGVSGDVALLYGAGVLPEYRGRGVHRALLRARLRIAANRGAATAFLKTQCNSIAERAAQSAGFVAVGERRRLHGPPPT